MTDSLRAIVADMRGVAQFVDGAGPTSYREALNAFADRVEAVIGEPADAATEQLPFVTPKQAPKFITKVTLTGGQTVDLPHGVRIPRRAGRRDDE